MLSIILFNIALICGIFASQLYDLEKFHAGIFFATDSLLAYIMVQVGLEFVIEKKKWRNYLVDYGVASLAAGLPWTFCFLYFLHFGESRWEENLLLARFAGPTATGLLFTLLTLAGLRATWLFKKVEVLVIFDDLDTILFLIPIQFLLSGGRIGLISIAFAMLILMTLGWRYMHSLKLPTSRGWLFFYAVVIGGLSQWLDLAYNLEAEVLLPAFTFGLMLAQSKKKEAVDSSFENRSLLVDRGAKLVFMFLIGLLLPKIAVDSSSLKTLGYHIFWIFLLMNLGKCAPLFFYKKEVPFKERLALCFSMMPRGEMGAGILTIALGYGIRDLMTQVATLSLALNLLLTSVFIWVVTKLVKPKKSYQ